VRIIQYNSQKGSDNLTLGELTGWGKLKEREREREREKNWLAGEKQLLSLSR
jgi:hypothetical protein